MLNRVCGIGVLGGIFGSILWSTISWSVDASSPEGSPSSALSQVQTLAPAPLASPAASTLGVGKARKAMKPTYNKNILVREFLKAQRSEIKALEHRHSLEMKELARTQSVREKEWKENEAEARHRFFGEHPNGSDRRIYIQDFIRRREAYLNKFKEEKKERKLSHKQRLNEVTQAQKVKFSGFEEALKAGKVPPESLWPKAGN